MFQTYRFIPLTKFVYKNIHYKLRQLNYCKSSKTKAPESKNTGDVVKGRRNFHEDCEDGLNKQVNLELHASYTYFCMWACLSRPDVALPGFAQFFAAAAEEERHHAERISSFINTRGGSVQLTDVSATTEGPFHDPAHALEVSIALETRLLEHLKELHTLANKHGDCHITDFLETHFIPEGYEGIRQLVEMLTRLNRAGPGVGVTLVDLDLVRNPPTMHTDKGK